MVRTPAVNGNGLARRVLAERSKRGWDQSELARRAGVSTSYVNKLESGAVKRPGLEAIARVASAFGISVEEVVLRERSESDERLLGQIIAIVGDSPEVAELTDAILTDLRRRPEVERVDILKAVAELLRIRDTSPR